MPCNAREMALNFLPAVEKKRNRFAFRRNDFFPYAKVNYIRVIANRLTFALNEFVTLLDLIPSSGTCYK